MSNRARVRQPKGKWASDDDAGSLLAGILDETEEDARAEQQRMAAAVRQREEERVRAREEEEHRKLVEAEERLIAEHHRQEALKERRTQKMEALRVEDLKARGEWVEPETPVEEVPEVSAHTRQLTPADVALAQRNAELHSADTSASTIIQAHPPTPEARRGGSRRLLGVMFALVCVGGIAAFLTINGQYTPDTTPYARTVLSPAATQNLSTVASIHLIPTERLDRTQPTRKRRARKAKRRPAKRKSKNTLSLDTKGLLSDM